MREATESNVFPEPCVSRPELALLRTDSPESEGLLEERAFCTRLPHGIPEDVVPGECSWMDFGNPSLWQCRPETKY